MMTLQLPFDAENKEGLNMQMKQTRVFKNIRTKEPAPISPALGYSDRLIELTRQLLIKDPKKRPSAWKAIEAFPELQAQVADYLESNRDDVREDSFMLDEDEDRVVPERL